MLKNTARVKMEMRGLKGKEVIDPVVSLSKDFVLRAMTVISNIQNHMQTTHQLVSMDRSASFFTKTDVASSIQELVYRTQRVRVFGSDSGTRDLQWV